MSLTPRAETPTPSRGLPSEDFTVPDRAAVIGADWEKIFCAQEKTASATNTEKTMERAFFLGTKRLHPSGKRFYNVFKYAIRSSTSFGSSPYWKPGISGPPFKIKPRNTFSWSGVASLNWPLRPGPTTGGDPNLSFLGRWQSEQRCRNKPSPRLASSPSFSATGGAMAGLLCASKVALPPA